MAATIQMVRSRDTDTRRLEDPDGSILQAGQEDVRGTEPRGAIVEQIDIPSKEPLDSIPLHSAPLPSACTTCRPWQLSVSGRALHPATIGQAPTATDTTAARIRLHNCVAPCTIPGAGHSRKRSEGFLHSARSIIVGRSGGSLSESLHPSLACKRTPPRFSGRESCAETCGFALEDS